MAALAIYLNALLIAAGGSTATPAGPPEFSPAALVVDVSRRCDSAEALRAAVPDALRRARAFEGDLTGLARELVGLHQALGATTALPEGERDRLRAMVHRQLLRVGDSLVVRWKRAQTAQRGRPIGPSQARDWLEANLGPAGASLATSRSGEAKRPAEAKEPLARGAGGGNRVDDYSEELIDLITRVVFPPQWEVNGGNSVIVYFPPTMSLVVSAPGEVHHEVGGLLRQFRRP